MSDCTYTIRPIEDLTLVDYSDIQQTSSDTARKNDQNGVDATDFVISWRGVMPTTVYQLEPIGDEDVKTCYTCEDLKEFIKDDLNWNNPQV